MSDAMNRYSYPSREIQESVGYMKVCYYTIISQDREGAARFWPEYIPPHLCTHILYAFATLANNTIGPKHENDEDKDGVAGMYSRVNALKTQNPDLKVLLTIGGYLISAEDPTNQELSTTANSQANRNTFIENAIPFLRERNFDGLDVDWEYPESVDQHFQLMKELRLAFDLEGTQTDRAPLLLSGTSMGEAAGIPGRYNMAELGNYVDFISIFSYEYTVSGTPAVIRHHSILYPDTDDAVNLWLNSGFPANKLLTGFATFAVTHQLANSSNNLPGSLTLGPGNAGPLSQFPGYLAYAEICEDGNGWTRVWDSDNNISYAYKGDQWVGYDNVRSAKLKAEYAISKGLGGVMVWAPDIDDFSNTCGEGTFPLTKTLFGTLDNQTSTTTT